MGIWLCAGSLSSKAGSFSNEVSLFPFGVLRGCQLAPLLSLIPVHDFRRSSQPHARARHLGFAHARA